MSELEKRWLDITNDYNSNISPDVIKENTNTILEKISEIKIDCSNMLKDDLSTVENRINSKLATVLDQLEKLKENYQTLLTLCQKIDSSIILQNEREVNLQIRKYSVHNKKQTNNPPLHFVPSSTSNKNHFGLFTGLLR